MSLRKPLVIVNGQIEQMQSGDTLSGPFAEIEGLSQTSGEAGGIAAGLVVYSSGNDMVKKAEANASGTVEAIGLATSTFITTGAGTVQTSGVFSLADWTAVIGSATLTAGTVYYLSASTAGQLTATAPVTVGQYVLRIGRAISTTELVISILQPVLL